MAGTDMHPSSALREDGASVSDWLRRPLRAYKWLIVVLIVTLINAIILIPVVMLLGAYAADVRWEVGDALVLAQRYAPLSLALAGILALLLLLSVGGELEYRRRVRVPARAMGAPAPAAIAAAPVPSPVKASPARTAPLPAMDDRPEALTTALVVAGRQAANDARGAPEGVMARSGLPLADHLAGRQSEIAEATELLRAESAVVLAAHGYQPGIGRSALAAEVAVALKQQEVVWVACDGLRGDAGSAELWARVARALDLAWLAEAPDVEVRRVTLHAAMADESRKAHVLVLDGLEPELDIEGVLETLGSGRMKLLLTACGPVDTPSARAIDVVALPDDAARQLLDQQVARLYGDGASQEDASTLADLIQFLEGSPLVIRLAAPAVLAHEGPWADLVTAFETAHRADEPRARLHSHLARAWDLATSQEQALLAGLSLLAGQTFPRAAALAIARATAEDMTDERAATAVDALIGLALLEARAGERLSLHGVIRQSAAERLSALDEDLVGQMGMAMVGYWLEHAQSHPHADMIEALDRESAGLLGAMSWAHEHARHRELLMLAHALIPFWYASGRLEDAVRALPWALESARALDESREIQFMQHEVALCLSQTGQTDAARAAFESALALARAHASRRDELHELQGLAELESGAHAWKTARDHFTAALEIAEALGDRREQRKAWHGLARLEAETGQLIVARERFEQALEVATLLADRRALRDDLFGLAGVEMRVGHTEQAQRYYAEALDLARALEDRWVLRESLHGLAQLEQRLGHFKGAEGHLKEALQLARQLGDLALQSVELQALGSLALDLVEPDQARGYVQDGLALARRLNQPSLIADALWWSAVLEERLGNRPAAREGFRAALEIYERLGSPEARTTRQRLSRLSSG